MKKILVLALSLILVFGLAGCKKDEPVDFEFDVPAEFNVNIQDLGYISYISLGNPTVTINVRDMGEIVFQLFPNVAPNTVNSFIKYIEDGIFTDNEFHRVIDGFMIQGGLNEDATCDIAGEMTNNGFANPVSHTLGVVSMARVGGLYDSASSQFFIVQRDSTHLDDDYAAFGGVISGFHIIDYIASLSLTTLTETTIVPVYIDSMTVELNGYVPAAVICVQ